MKIIGYTYYVAMWGLFILFCMKNYIGSIKHPCGTPLILLVDKFIYDFLAFINLLLLNIWLYQLDVKLI